jgi:hypothetical protein
MDLLDDFLIEQESEIAEYIEKIYGGKYTRSRGIYWIYYDEILAMGFSAYKDDRYNQVRGLL